MTIRVAYILTTNPTVTHYRTFTGWTHADRLEALARWERTLASTLLEWHRLDR